MKTLLRAFSLPASRTLHYLCCVLVFTTAFVPTTSAQAPPVISAFSPTSGPVGTTVTIAGSNFSPNAADNIVYFGAVKATVVTSTSTTLAVTVPAGATYKPITVTSKGLISYANKPFITTFANNCSDFQSNSFALKAGFDVGSSALGNVNSIQMADFDGDGKPDLAVVVFAGVSFYRNMSTVGNISFAGKVFYSALARYDIEIGDLNGDGKPDLVTSSDDAPGAASVTILINTSTPGNISFNLIQNFQTGDYRGLTISDFDGDGKPDIAAASKGVVFIFRNTTSGGLVSFATKVGFPVGDSFYLEAADLDNDGKPDLAMGSGSGPGVLRNTSSAGNISFASEVSFPFPAGIAIGDLNEDGKPDIASGTIFKNNSSTGNIQWSRAGSVGGSSYPVISDLNGDGKPDLAGTTGLTPSLSVYKNTETNGEIDFADGVDFSSSFGSPAKSTGVSVGDLDLDGKPDVVLGLLYTTPFVVFRNQIGEVPCGAINPPTITSFSPATGPVGSTVTITGTNFAPVAANNIVYFGAVKAMVTAATSTSLTVTVPTGATYQPITVTTHSLTAYSNNPFVVTFANTNENLSTSSFFGKEDFATENSPASVAIADFNGDGKPDMVVGNFSTTSPTISIFSNTGNGQTITFADRINLPVGSASLGNPPGINNSLAIATGDFDGDGRLDIAVTNRASNTVSFFKNISSGGMIAFQAKVDYATGTNPSHVAIGDLDKDGKPDIVVTNESSSSVSIFRNVSAASSLAFAPKIDFTVGNGPEEIAIGDVDGDNLDDLSVVNFFSGTVSVLRNVSSKGVISFASKIDYPAGAQPTSIAMGDLNEDGKPDLAIANYPQTISTVSIFKNLSTPGNIAFATKTNYPVGTSPISIAITDLNGDGIPDVVTANIASSTVSVLRNTSSIVSIAFATKVDYPSGTDPKSLAIGDLNGDGKPDLIVANYSSNTVSVLVNKMQTLTTCTPPIFKNDATIVLDASCGNNDGQISIIPTGGVAPFQYSINGGATYKTGANTGSGFTNLAAGTYKLRLKDANGCESAVVEKTVRTIYGGPTFTYKTADASCGSNNGSISIVPTNSTTGYMYSLDAGATYVPGPASGFTFNNLSANTYYLRIKNAAGCQSKIVYEAVHSCGSGCTPPTFKNDATIVLDASCGNNDGQISIIPTSGTAPFMYSIDGGLTYKTGANTGSGFTNLAPGTYRLRLKDAKGCESAVIERTIRSIYGGPTFTYKTSEATCGNKNGSITIVPTSGTGPFMYSIDAGNTYVQGPSTGYTFTNLAPNTYYLRVKSAAGCESAIIYEAVKDNFSNCTGAFVQANITALQMAISPEVVSTDAIKAYPNPTKGQFKLQLKGFTSSKAEVSIYNGEGKLVQKRQLNLAGTSTADFDLTGKAKGMYYIKITSNSGTRTLKVSVQ